MLRIRGLAAAAVTGALARGELCATTLKFTARGHLTAEPGGHQCNRNVTRYHMVCGAWSRMRCPCPRGLTTLWNRTSHESREKEEETETAPRSPASLASSTGASLAALQRPGAGGSGPIRHPRWSGCDFCDSANNRDDAHGRSRHPRRRSARASRTKKSRPDGRTRSSSCTFIQRGQCRHLAKTKAIWPSLHHRLPTSASCSRRPRRHQGPTTVDRDGYPPHIFRCSNRW